MAQKLTAALPPDFDLGANFIVSVTVVDPTTGALVSGVNVSNVTLMAAAVVAPITQDEGPDYAPLFLPVPSEPPAVEETSP